MHLVRHVMSVCLGLAAALATATPQPPALRLGNDVQPERMWLDLTLSPENTDYSGKVEVDLRINTAVDHFWLNATELNVSAAKVIKNGRTFQAQVLPGGEDFVGFQFPSKLQPGKA